MAKRPEILAFEKKYCKQHTIAYEDATGKIVGYDIYIGCSTPPRCKYLDKQGNCPKWELELKKFWADYPKNTIPRNPKKMGEFGGITFKSIGSRTRKTKENIKGCLAGIKETCWDSMKTPPTYTGNEIGIFGKKKGKRNLK